MTVTTDTDATTRANRIRVLIGAVVIQLILGTVYGYSIFWQPLDNQLGLAVSQANYAFAICILSFAVTMVIAGRVQDVTGPRFPAIVGAILMGVGFLIASLVTKPFVFYLAHAAFTGAVGIILLMIFHAMVGKLDAQQMPILQYVPMGIMAAVVTAGVLLGNEYVGHLGEMDQLFLLYGTVGFLAGAGIGFAYVCPIAALVKWFPNQKGLVSGIAVAGFGFGAFIFAHKQFPLSAENYIRQHSITDLFQIHGIVCLVVVTLGAMLLKNPPGTATKRPGESADSNWQDTLRRPAFYVLWIMYFSGAMAGLMVIGILKPFAGSQLVEAAGGAAAITEDQRIALLAEGVASVGWLAIFNAVGRVVWGFVSDKIGRTIAFAAMYLLQAAAMFLLIQMDTPMSLSVAASVIGFNYGGLFALFPSATADLFGAKNLGANYGWVFTSYGIAGLVGTVGLNKAVAETGDYGAAFKIAACLCVVSAVLAIGLQSSIKRQKARAAAA